MVTAAGSVQLSQSGQGGVGQRHGVITGMNQLSALTCDCASTEDTVYHRQLLQSAGEFWQELSDEEQAYLALHACDENGEPLNQLAARLNISSYHYKAGKLGITAKKGDLPADYQRSHIGQWMQGKLGLSFTHEFAAEIRTAFEALCAVATNFKARLAAADKTSKTSTV